MKAGSSKPPKSSPTPETHTAPRKRGFRMEQKTPKRRGPKPIPPERRRLARFEIRTTPELHAKILRNGGARWIESLVRKAKEIDR